MGASAVGTSSGCGSVAIAYSTPSRLVIIILKVGDRKDFYR
jgi:hypothetical protein